MGIVDLCYEFVTKWGLTDEAQECFVSLPRDKWAVAMLEFVAADGDPSIQFILYADRKVGGGLDPVPVTRKRSALEMMMAEQQRQTPSMTQALEMLSQYGAGEAASAHVAAQTMLEAPRKLALRAPKLALALPEPAEPKPTHPGIDVEEIQAFVDKWGLNHNSVDRIQKLSSLALKVVITDFDPPGKTMDINGRFIAFASHVDRDLRDGTRLPPKHLEHLDNGRPERFGTGAAKLAAIPGNDTSLSAEAIVAQAMAQEAAAQAAAAMAPYGAQAALEPIATQIGAELATFAMQHGLNTDAQLMLVTIAQMSPQALQIVMSQFRPPSGAENVSGNFIAFAGKALTRLGLPGINLK